MSDNNALGNSDIRSGNTYSSSGYHNKDGTSPSSNHRRGLSGLASSSSFNRRSSLGMTEAAFGDLFGRRASGFSDFDALGRRGSLDSTSAVLDAAIMDLTRRRLSMAMGAGMPGDDPFGSGGGYGAAMGMGGMGGLGMDAMGGAGAYGMSSLGPLTPSSSSAMGMSSYPPAPTARESSAEEAESSLDMDSQQREIQEQQRELERRQKELEIQRQQLMAAMEERRLVMQQMQQKLGQSMPGGSATGSAMAMQRNSLMGTFGGGLGSASYGGASSNLLMAGYGGGGRTFPGSGGGPPMGVPAAGANPEWSVCRICNSRAFASREEAIQHEAICMNMGRRSSLGLGGGGRRSSLDLLVGTLDRPEFAARFAGQSFRQDGNSGRDSLGLGVMSDRRYSLLGMGGMGGMSGMSGMSGMGNIGGMGGMSGMGDMPIQAPSYPAPTHIPIIDTNHQKQASIPTTTSSGPFAMMEQPLSLAMESDKDWLTPLHCFVRKHCVHVFTATNQDVQTPSKGKRKPIQVGQVGIRCPHCHHDIESSIKARERGSVYYPTSISSIYNATMNLLQRHLHNCSSVPTEVMRRYETLKADDARSGTSKKYWIESALSLGLVDSENGIRFSAKTPPPLPGISRQQMSTADDLYSNNMMNGMANNDGDDMMSNLNNSEAAGGGRASSKAASKGSSKGVNSKMLGPLVQPEDEAWATAFSFHLMSQMQPCVFTEADRLGKRKGLPPGFPGLACRHCFGGYGSGRFFPSSIKTLSDTSKTLNVLHNHMMRCRKCPPKVRELLAVHRKTHDEQRAKMKFGSQKAFFARIWDRLHYKDPNVTHKRKFKASDEPNHHQQQQPPPASQSQVGVFDAAMAMQQQQQYADLINKRQKI